MKGYVDELIRYGINFEEGNEWDKTLYQRMRLEGAKVYWGKDWEKKRRQVEKEILGIHEPRRRRAAKNKRRKTGFQKGRYNLRGRGI